MTRVHPTNKKKKKKTYTARSHQSEFESPKKVVLRRRRRNIHQGTTTPITSLPSVVHPSDRAREKTPDRVPEVFEVDTPVRERLGENSSVLSLYVLRQRDAIIYHIGSEVAEDSMDYFFQNILPPIKPEFDIDRILARCVRNKLLAIHRPTGKYHWTCFKLESECHTHETKVYNGPITEIFNEITKAALDDIQSPKPEVTCQIHADGNKATWSLKESELKPDAHLFIKSTYDTNLEILDGKHWYNVALSFHFKKTTNSVEESYKNKGQVLHSMHHCMAIDPCRRFSLGATIEGRQMRLWHYNRSIIICSEEFDFDSDPRTMIKVVLSLVFADKVDLGWDPTVVARYDGKQGLFDFEVDGKLFKTSTANILADTKADGIYTSATRIFKAFTEDDEEEKSPVIIKDYWPAECYKTEDVIQRMILEDIRDEEDRELVKNMTLTPIASGRVGVDGQEDHTRKTILRDRCPKEKYTIKIPDSIIGSKVSTVKRFEGRKKYTNGQASELAQEILKNRWPYIHRWHYRIVYKEYAVPYYKLRRLDDMLLVLICAVKVLRVIHKAGWVHRDISTDNLYLYVDPVTGEKRGLVGDLEYAKRGGTGGKCAVRTGTDDFMASEINMNVYQFGLHESEPTGKDPAETRDVDDEGFGGICANYIHDLESIWWIVIWTLFNYQEASLVASGGEEYRETSEAQKNTISQLFNGIKANATRYFFLSIPATFTEFMKSAPQNLKKLKQGAILSRVFLVDHYIEKERMGDHPIKLTDGGSLHDGILEALYGAFGSGLNVEIIHEQPESRVPEERTKRKMYSSRDDDKQLLGDNRPIQKMKRANITPSMSSLDQDASRIVETDTDGTAFGSGLVNAQYRPNKQLTLEILVPRLSHVVQRRKRYRRMKPPVLVSTTITQVNHPSSRFTSMKTRSQKQGR